MDHNRTQKIVSDALNLPLDMIDEGLTIENCENWDSLSHVRLIIAIESEIGRPLRADEIVGIAAVSDVQKILLSSE